MLDQSNAYCSEFSVINYMKFKFKFTLVSNTRSDIIRCFGQQKSK